MTSTKNIDNLLKGQIARIRTTQYAYTAQNTLQQRDYDSLMKTSEEVIRILNQSGLPIDRTGTQVWPAGAERLNAQVKANLSAVPALADRFKQHIGEARSV